MKYFVILLFLNLLAINAHASGGRLAAEDGERRSEEVVNRVMQPQLLSPPFYHVVDKAEFEKRLAKHTGEWSLYDGGPENSAQCPRVLSLELGGFRDGTQVLQVALWAKKGYREAGRSPVSSFHWPYLNANGCTGTYEHEFANARDTEKYCGWVGQNLSEFELASGYSYDKYFERFGGWAYVGTDYRFDRLNLTIEAEGIVVRYVVDQSVKNCSYTR